MKIERWRCAARAWLLQFLGKNELAYAEYARLNRLAPSAAVAGRLGFLAAETQRLQDSARWFEEAVRLDAGNAQAWFNLGFVREQNGERRAAIAAFREAVRLAPELDRAWYGMGLAHAALGEHAEAAQAFEENVRRQTMFGDAWFQLGMAHHHARNPERVAEIVRRLRTFEPKRANQLIRDTGRGDLAHLHSELPF